MFKNIPFILRRFGRHKLTTSLHVIGLTLGITVCLLIGLFIKHELSFDGYEQKASRTYRVNQVWVDDGKKTFHFSTPFPLADEIRKSIAGLENVTKVHHPFSTVVEINPVKRFKQDHVMMTDPEFLDVFDVKAVEGNAYESLRKPYYAVLTQSTAKKFYGNEDPLGKVFKWNDNYNITVGAVIPDFPGNTHLPASMLLSFSTDEKFLQTSTTHYGSVSGGSTFIVLSKGVNVNATLKAGLQGIYDRTVNKEAYMIKSSHCELEIQPLSDVHFNSKYAGGGNWVSAINKSWLWFFGSVGFAVLLLACINFINLTTAQASQRAKEIGIRKTMGGHRRQLTFQFLTETFVLTLVATIFSLLLTPFLLKMFADFIPADWVLYAGQGPRPRKTALTVYHPMLEEHRSHLLSDERLVQLADDVVLHLDRHFPGLRRQVAETRVFRRGHALPMPTPGQLARADLASRAHGPIVFAHSDSRGDVSSFPGALRAAKQAVAALG